ncbi:hypothetical protein GCM10012275_51820 [Longimycelium tulufanense]|uniref:Uncharacterized protein n=1 Tax=Longimycelium tulufanense TaxID=907463 RepID=A0A8J3CIR0_9PSEU|nr:hypothetical protein [Longimycelium tulufanense]GGM74768.1 hypothetical protein GCM10012275_51820 [Longimycelium tulufanense]
MVAPDDRDPERGERHQLLRWLATLLANVTVLTALLVFFGWRRAHFQARSLGLDESIFDLTTTEYLLRSVDAAFAAVLLLSLAGLIWALVDGPLSRWAARNEAGPVSRTVLAVFAGSWVWLPMLFGLIWQWRPVIGFVGVPVSFGAGVLLSLYALHLRRQRVDPSERTRVRAGLVKGFAAAVATVTIFWSAGHYAEVVGRNLARDFEPRQKPAVVLYSEQRLHISAPGTEELPLDAIDSGYRFKYTGLRLLDRSGGKHFLISEGWPRADGVLVVLPDDLATRLEFVRQ